MAFTRMNSNGTQIKLTEISNKCTLISTMKANERHFISNNAADWMATSTTEMKRSSGWTDQMKEQIVTDCQLGGKC